MSLFPYPAVLDGMGEGGRSAFVLKYLSVTANKLVGGKNNLGLS